MRCTAVTLPVAVITRLVRVVARSPRRPCPSAPRPTPLRGSARCGGAHQAPPACRRCRVRPSHRPQCQLHSPPQLHMASWPSNPFNDVCGPSRFPSSAARASSRSPPARATAWPTRPSTRHARRRSPLTAVALLPRHLPSRALMQLPGCRFTALASWAPQLTSYSTLPRGSFGCLLSRTPPLTACLLHGAVCARCAASWTFTATAVLTGSRHARPFLHPGLQCDRRPLAHPHARGWPRRADVRRHGPGGRQRQRNLW
jgi:hypothetical protein